jgi:hypothetical protein
MLTCADACRIFIKSLCISFTVCSSIFSGSSTELTAQSMSLLGRYQEDAIAGKQASMGYSTSAHALHQSCRAPTQGIGIRASDTKQSAEEVHLNSSGSTGSIPGWPWHPYKLCACAA